MFQLRLTCSPNIYVVDCQSKADSWNTPLFNIHYAITFQKDSDIVGSRLVSPEPNPHPAPNHCDERRRSGRMSVPHWNKFDEAGIELMVGP